MRKLLGAMSAMALVACGGPGSVSGPIAGSTLDVADGILLNVSQQGMTMGAVVLTSFGSACDTAKAHHDLKGASGLSIALMDIQGTGTVAPTPGEYNIVSGNGAPSGKTASADFFKNKADSCDSALDDKAGKASSGKVTVTSYDAAKGAEGTFELNFSGGEKVTGSFNVAACAVDLTSNTASTCQ